ncbi:MerR family transcriptional regulator [Reinekea marina]|uniref:MerR family transcriptional regulator n=2 Tax=Reinekea marina TaxID=1310421 RepID=A0ABV7WTP4_9GAMM
MQTQPPKTIGEAAKFCHVSVKTLRHYDAIGLLKPSVRSQANYRLYTQSDLEKLHSILVYRALGLSLKQVSEILAADGLSKIALLQQQYSDLEQHIDRLTHIKSTVKEMIQKETTPMKNKQFDAFKGFDPDLYEAETREKWGHTEAYKESKKRTQHYSKDDWEQYNKKVDALNQTLAEHLKQGLPSDDSQVIETAENMRLLIDQWFYPCSKEMHANLGQMYTMDERFTAYYESIHPGLANYLMHATQANLQHSPE